MHPISYLLWQKAWLIGLVSTAPVLTGASYLARSEKMHSATATIASANEQGFLRPALAMRVINRPELEDVADFRSRVRKSKSETWQTFEFRDSDDRAILEIRRLLARKCGTLFVQFSANFYQNFQYKQQSCWTYLKLP